MGKKSKARWAKKAARNAERRAALKEAEEKEGFARRCAAKEKAKEFAEQWIPCAERAGALCYQLQRKVVKKWAKEEGTTVMFMALERMSMYCRFCGKGYWGCRCEYDELGWVIEQAHWYPPEPPEEEEVKGKRKRKKKKKDKKKKKQNEGLHSPAEKKPEEKDISPEINKIAASSSSQSGGKRALFAK